MARTGQGTCGICSSNRAFAYAAFALMGPLFSCLTQLTPPNLKTSATSTHSPLSWLPLLTVKALLEVEQLQKRLTANMGPAAGGFGGGLLLGLRYG